ncbi:MAG: hypothetical protein ACRC8C_02645 [Mycoplasmoidaceae bacterium]
MEEKESKKVYIDEENIKKDQEQKQDQEQIFIGDQKLKDYYDFSKKSVRNQIICLALFFLLIPLVVLVVLDIIWAIKSIIVNLDDNDISQSATIMGVLCLFFIPAFICGLILNSKIKNKYFTIDIK